MKKLLAVGEMHSFRGAIKIHERGGVRDEYGGGPGHFPAACPQNKLRYIGRVKITMAALGRYHEEGG